MNYLRALFFRSPAAAAAPVDENFTSIIENSPTSSSKKHRRRTLSDASVLPLSPPLRIPDIILCFTRYRGASASASTCEYNIRDLDVWMNRWIQTKSPQYKFITLDDLYCLYVPLAKNSIIDIARIREQIESCLHDIQIHCCATAAAAAATETIKMEKIIQWNDVFFITNIRVEIQTRAFMPVFSQHA